MRCARKRTCTSNRLGLQMHLWTPGFEKLWIQQSANSLLTGMNIFDIYFENTTPITWSRKLFKQIVWNINLLIYFILRTMAAKAANCKLKNMVLRMQPFRANATAEMQKRWLQFCFIRIFLCIRDCFFVMICFFHNHVCECRCKAAVFILIVWELDSKTCFNAKRRVILNNRVGVQLF